MSGIFGALDHLSSALFDLLVVLAALVVPVVLISAWWRGRRRQLLVNTIVNSSGRPALDGVTVGLTHLARQRLDAEIWAVARRQDELRQRLAGGPVSGGHSPTEGGNTGARPGVPRRRRTPAIGRLQDQLDTGMSNLLSAAREVAPEPTRTAFALFTTLVSRPRGLAVSGLLQSRTTNGQYRLGVSFDVRQLGTSQSLDSTTFWEPEAAPAVPAAAPGTGTDPAGDAAEWTERVLALLAPASRWVAVRMVVAFVFPSGPGAREHGLDSLLSGTLLAQSVEAFPEQAATLRRRAVNDLLRAADQLTDSPRHLAALADTLDRLAAYVPPDVAVYRQAHSQYARTIAALTARVPPQTEFLQRYRVREATSWFASGQPEVVLRAASWLSDGGPDFAQNATSDDLYDASCLFALGAAATGDSGGPNASLLSRAATLLLQALRTSSDSRSQIAQGLRDAQLAPLHHWLLLVQDRWPADDRELLGLLIRVV